MPFDIAKIPDDQWDAYADEAITAAISYIQSYKGSPRLQTIKAEDQPEIDQFLDGYPAFLAADKKKIKALLQDAVKDFPRAEAGAKVTYFSGAYGAKDRLLAAAAKNDTADEKIMHDALETSMMSDFAKIKAHVGQNFSVEADEMQKKYPKWRPLASGIDVALERIALEQGINYIQDNSMAHSTAEAGEATWKRLDGYKENGKKIQVFAVALTPEQAAEQARDDRSKITEEEARRSAHDFHTHFSGLTRHAADVTLFDKDMNVIYRQQNGQEVVRNQVKMQVWEASFDTGQGSTIPKQPEHGLNRQQNAR